MSNYVHEDVDFEVITPDMLADLGDGYAEDEVDFNRIIWDGYRMVTQEEFDAEMAAAGAYA